MNKEKEEIRGITQRVKNELCTLVGDKRARHVLAVASLSLYLADVFNGFGANVDTDETECAAVLHDIAKHMDVVSVCKQYGAELSADDLDSPETIHAIAGAYYAKDKYAVSDSIYSAIKKHTVGHEKMSLIDNIIFVADYCEETRIHEECQKTRRRLLEIKDYAESHGNDSKERLSAAVLYLEYIKCEILFKTVRYLSEKSDKIHSGTVLTLRAVFRKFCDTELFKAFYVEYSDIISQYSL